MGILVKKKIKIKNPSHSFLDNNRLRGHSDYYSVGSRNVLYSEDPKTYRYIDLYEFLEEHFPSDIAKSKRATYSNSTMNKLYERLIFYPDTHGMSANFVLLDRVKQNKDFDRFHSYLQDKILNGVRKYRKNPSHSTKAIENELKKLGFGSLVLSLRQEKPSSSDLKYYLKVVDGTRAELTKKEFSDKDYKRVKKLVTMWFKGV